jgi:hypothetical protein
MDTRATLPDGNRQHRRRRESPSRRPDVEVRDLHVAISHLPLAEDGKRALYALSGGLAWMQRYARRNRVLHSIFRLTVVVGGVTVPALVSLDLRGDASTTVRWATFGISLLAAISAAIDELFSYGDKWRHYRGIAEALKSEGWSFVQLTGPYRGRTHAETAADFAGVVERIAQEESSTYLTTIAVERDDGASGRGGQPQQ